MHLRKQETCTLFDIPVYSPTGEASARALGEIRALFVSRSSEENNSEDISHAAETLSVLIPGRYTPPGGFVRGMSLEKDGAVYRMLTPVNLGRLWSVKCLRIHIG